MTQFHEGGDREETVAGIFMELLKAAAMSQPNGVLVIPFDKHRKAAADFDMLLKMDKANNCWTVRVKEAEKPDEVRRVWMPKDGWTG